MWNNDVMGFVVGIGDRYCNMIRTMLIHLYGI